MHHGHDAARGGPEERHHAVLPRAVERRRAEDGHAEELRVAQRRLLGHILARVYEAQDALAILCVADEAGRMSAEKKRWFMRVNRALFPWIPRTDC